MNVLEKRPTDPLFWFSALSAGLTLLIGLGFYVYLFWASWPLWRDHSLSFFTSTDWFPGESYGALAMIYGSVMVSTLALVTALPFALAGAVTASEFLSPRLRLVFKAAMELMAGVPGIVYGLLGAALLALWVKDWFGLIDGNTLFTAGILLGVMILPTIMTLAEDAIHSVPREFRETAASLGLPPLQAFFRVVFPQALPGIVGAVLLGLGRALGETIAVMLVIGGLDMIPSPWFDWFAPGQSIPSKLGREAAEAIGSGMHWNALLGLGCALFSGSMLLTGFGSYLLRRRQR
ncbi:MAG: phosphate ABC transporter permease subunit PstC [Candidatus Nitrohelix vancouverensis]|uniref:Phosphate transport system permease protein n=1 Tax=Candidatus Nitrohelix vancouverensis TaxID=2705534 RepID=A0A7T0G3G8_9BACT|nr:MAG: phosphate ABC transporter permease subunit PstC [Candidatus Nitrohelix vancouverensis]